MLVPHWTLASGRKLWVRMGPYEVCRCFSVWIYPLRSSWDYLCSRLSLSEEALGMVLIFWTHVGHWNARKFLMWRNCDHQDPTSSSIVNISFNASNVDICIWFGPGWWASLFKIMSTIMWGVANSAQMETFMKTCGMDALVISSMKTSWLVDAPFLYMKGLEIISLHHTLGWGWPRWQITTF